MNIIKDPSAILPYAFNWTAWLDEGEIITSATVTAEDDLTVATNAIDAGRVVAWLDGGTEGEHYDVRCFITTSLGKQDPRTLHITVRTR